MARSLHHRTFALLFLLLFCVCAAPLHAQSTGTISGTITDQSGAIVPRASVQVKSTNTGAIRTLNADEQGRYSAREIPIGSYEVSVSKAGFTTSVRPNIVLSIGAQPIVDFQLGLGQQSQTVTVQDQVSQVETTSTAVGVLVETKQIQDLPLNGRNFTQLIALNPGVTQIPQGAPGAGNQFYGNGQKYSIAGGRPSGQAYLLDGTDMTNFWNNGPGAAGLGTALGIDSIAEFQTLINTYSSQYGGNGAVINASSRSGSNAFHGSLYEFLRNNVLETRNVFDINRPPFRQNQFGGSLGGPVVKNKAFFFVNYEGLRSSKVTTGRVVVPDDDAQNFRLPNAQGVLVPVAENSNPTVRQAVRNTLALFPRPSTLIRTSAGLATGTGFALVDTPARGTENYFLGRLDYTFSEKDSVFARYLLDFADNDTASGDNALYAWWPQLLTTRSHYATVQETHVFSPRLVNLSRISFTRPAEDGAAYGSPVVNNGLASPGTYSTAGVHPLQFFGVAEGRHDGIVNPGSGITQLGPAGALPFYLIQNKFGVGDDVIWTAGAHSFKLGGVATRHRENTWAPQREMTWNFGTLNNFLAGNPQQVVGYLSRAQNPALDPFKDYRYWVFGLYAEDQWKATSRLTVNLGLRYSPTTKIGVVRHPLYTLVNPPFGNWVVKDAVTGDNPSLHNFDPRIGVAWDPFKDHKTSIRAGFGMFHAVVFARETVNWFQPPFIAVSQSAAQGLTYPVPFSNFPAGTGLVIPTDGTLSVNVGTTYQVNHAPYQTQWNFNIQREIVPQGVLSVSYVGSSNVGLFIQSDVNSPIPFIGPSGRPTFGVLNAAKTAVVANPRLNPAYSSLNYIDNRAHGTYNGLQTSFTKRFARNWQSQVSYTFAKSIDNGSGSFGLDGGTNNGNPFALSNERGLANFDRRHNFRLSGLYALPFKGKGAAGKLIEGWQVTGIYSYLSGSWISPASSQFMVHNSNGSNTGRPDLVPGCQLYPDTQTLVNWFNPNCFALQPAGTYGNAGRDIILGPNLWNLDSSLVKDTRFRRISEQFLLQFRAEVFNLLNHPSFQNPNSSIFASIAGGRVGTAGQISATNSQPRQIQLSLKILF